MYLKKLFFMSSALICFSGFITGCNGGDSSKPESFWEKNIGIEGNNLQVESVQADNNAVYISGTTDAKTLDEQSVNGTRNLFVQKYDKDGNKEWSVLRASSIVNYGFVKVFSAFDGTSLYVVSNINEQSMMYMLGINTVTDEQIIDRSSSAGHVKEIKNLAVNDRYLALLGSEAQNSIKIVLFDKKGDKVSEKTYSTASGGGATINPYSVCFLENTLYLTGLVNGQLTWDGKTFSPDVQDSFIACFSIGDTGTLTCEKIEMVNDGENKTYAYAACGHDGYLYLTGSADSSLFLAKYSADLSKQKWINQLTAAGETTRGQFISVSDNGIYVAGSKKEDTGCMIMEKYDFDGNIIWSKESGENTSASGVAAVDRAVYFVGNDYSSDKQSSLLIKQD